MLFVGNLSAVANAQYLERLFSAYGEVQGVEMFGDSYQRFAEITFTAVDDADAAIAALHYRYETSRNLPLIVLYSRKSGAVTQYGHAVGQEFRKAAEEKRMPEWIPLECFDPNYERNTVQLPPTEVISENRQDGGFYE